VSDGPSEILALLRRGDREAAEQLARTLPVLDIFEASALGALEHIIEQSEEDSACVNAYDAAGWTPLHLAACFDNKACVKELLRRGAQPDALSRNAVPVTALGIARSRKNEEISAILRAAGAPGHTTP
jgi:ankyrin repeat protein